MLQGIKCFFLLLIISVAIIKAEKDKNNEAESRGGDLETSPTSAKLFNLGGLFGQNSNYPYGYGSYYPNTYYRPQYPSTGGYYPNNNNYYPSSVWTAGSQNYPGQGYYGNAGSSYPSTGSYYPSNGFYPSSGTNILGGNGGYGGYGGNGGLRQYAGYLSPEYTGRRYRGYGYYADTDRYGLPRNWRGGNNDYDSYSYSSSYGYGRERDRVPGSYHGYN